MKNATIVVVALMLGCAVGFFSGWRIKSKQAQHELAEKTYQAFKQAGFCGCSWGFYDPDLWRRELGEELTPALEQPYPDSSMPQDYIWGAAYWTMRDKGYKTWSYVDGMSQGQQDEMIRYLCFRITRHAGLSESSRLEFQALATYPQETTTRNQAKIRPAIVASEVSDHYENRCFAYSYAVHLTDSDWGVELCESVLYRTASLENNYFPTLLESLDKHANGEYAFTDDMLGLQSKPTTTVQSGAYKVLAWVVQRDRDNTLIKSDLGKLATIQKLRNDLILSASRPTTQQDQ